MDMRKRRPIQVLARVSGLLALFLLSLLGSAAAGFGLDETWFLQVVNRVANGETLYRDVFFLSTPLSVQVSVLAAHILGSQLIVEKAVTTLAFVAELWCADRLLREIGTARWTRWVAWLALFVYTQHFPNPPYRAFGSALMLASFLALTVWLRRSESGSRGTLRWLVFAGALAGATFAAMPNHGLLTLGSILVVAILQARAARVPTRAVAGGAIVVVVAFAAVAGLVLVPVLVHGAWTELVDYTIRNKGPYVRAGGASIMTELRTLLVINPLDAAALSRLYRGFGVVLVPVALTSTTVAALRTSREKSPLAVAILLLVIASVAGAYPRLNRFHLSYASPGLIVGIVYSWMVLTSGLNVPRAAVRTVVAAWTLPGVLLTLAGTANALGTRDLVWSTVPHFTAIRMPAKEDKEIRERAARMRDVIGMQPLLVGTHASLYYLAAGLRNPTPFDESSVMSFGPQGQQQTIAAIAEGRVGPVCLEPLQGPLTPSTLIGYVTSSMRRTEDLGICTVYR
jgi:hypothetical protein